jgi:glycosyltransferase involved in cell wall biosynthesis
MFIANLPTVPYSDPWNVPLHERIKALARGKRRVAYFYENPNNSTFRYRAYNMVQVLNDEKNRDVSASYFFLDDLHLFGEIADLADVLVICRSRYSHRINHLVTKFRVRGKRILFDIDDFVFNPSYAHLIISTLGQDTDNSELWDYWFAYSSRMGETLRLCDGAITTNDYLAARITEFSGLPVNVVPNYINKEQLNLSETLFRSKEASGFARDDKICLGYFSGSPSHTLDYAIITSALEEVLDNDQRVELMLVGYIEAGPSLSRFGDRIKRQPFHDYVNLQRLIGSVEFNLMPLQSNVFTNCKSELKHFEAAIVGTLSIASPSHTYAAAIQDGENGYIAQAHQWASVIQRAIENIGMYPDIAATAYAHARSKYAWFNQRESILQALGME